MSYHLFFDIVSFGWKGESQDNRKRIKSIFILLYLSYPLKNTEALVAPFISGSQIHLLLKNGFNHLTQVSNLRQWHLRLSPLTSAPYFEALQISLAKLLCKFPMDYEFYFLLKNPMRSLKTFFPVQSSFVWRCTTYWPSLSRLGSK